MRYCQHCHAYYYKKETTCTICGRPLIEKNYESKVITQGYPTIKLKSNKAKFVSKIFGVISIAVVIILAMINFATYNSNPTPWSLIAIGPIVYAWILLSQIVVSKHNYPTKVNRQVVLMSLILILIDVITEYKAWSLTYVIPALLVTTTIILPIVVASKPKTYYLHVRSLFFLIILNFVVGIIGFTTPFMEPGVTWTSLSVIAVGILLVSAMFTFARKDTWTELIKIFRI